MLKQQFNQIAKNLRGKKAHFKNFLKVVHIKDLRGISDLSIEFTYPVSVIAGPNACGKSTVLFSVACAYKVPNSGIKDFVPSTMFPNLKETKNYPHDKQSNTELTFYYKHEGKEHQMKWSKGKNWNKSGSDNLERDVYLRTLSNLTNPSEVRNVLSISSKLTENTAITSDLLAFAESILPLKYTNVQLLSSNNKDILFAVRGTNDETQYSEFHMSAGERAIIRLSKDISKLKNALILIDELEAGLHPYTQQQLMLELQRLALRNDLQIIVTSHSPIILESVPPEGRIFLERTEDNVIVQLPYKDILQKAFYGQTIDKLSILCEDIDAEGMIAGVLDVLNPKLNLQPDDIIVGRDTGKEEFAQHIKALSRFHKMDSFILVLDGDARNLEDDLKEIGKKLRVSPNLVFLPSNDVPEVWLWQILSQYTEEYNKALGISNLATLIKQYDQMYQAATDKPSDKAKNKLFSFARHIKREIPDIFRIVARQETILDRGDMAIFVKDLELAIINWRETTYKE
jgi:predicted ATPase